MKGKAQVSAVRAIAAPVVCRVLLDAQCSITEIICSNFTIPNSILCSGKMALVRLVFRVTEREADSAVYGGVVNSEEGIGI